MALVRFRDGRGWSPSTGFVTRAGADHIAQQDFTTRSRDYFARNRGGVGSSSIGVGSSSIGVSSGGSSGGSANNSQQTTQPTTPEIIEPVIPSPTTPTQTTAQKLGQQLTGTKSPIETSPKAILSGGLASDRARYAGAGARQKLINDAKKAQENDDLFPGNKKSTLTIIDKNTGEVINQGYTVEQPNTFLEQSQEYISQREQEFADTVLPIDEPVELTKAQEATLIQTLNQETQTLQASSFGGFATSETLVDAKKALTIPKRFRTKEDNTIINTAYVQSGASETYNTQQEKKTTQQSTANKLSQNQPQNMADLFGSGEPIFQPPLDTKTPTLAPQYFTQGGRDVKDTILTAKTKSNFKSYFTGDLVDKVQTLDFWDVASKGGLGDALLKEAEGIDLTKEEFPLMAGLGQIGLNIFGIPASYAQGGAQILGETLTGGKSPLRDIQDQDFIYKSSRGYRDESSFITQAYSPEKALFESGELIRTDPGGAFVKFGLDALDFIPFVAPIGIRLLSKTKLGQKALIKVGKYNPLIYAPSPGIGKLKSTDVIGLELGRGSKYLVDGVPSSTKIVADSSPNVFNVIKKDLLKINKRKAVISEAPEGFGYVVSKFTDEIRLPGGTTQSIIGKPIPSQLATAEDTFTSIGGTTQYISSVTPGKTPFKFSLRGQQFDVVAQPDASLLRSFSGLAQEGKLPSPELGFFSSPETIRKTVLYTFDNKRGTLEPFLLPSERVALETLQASAKTKVVSKLQDFLTPAEYNLIESVAKGKKGLAVKGSAGEQLFTLKNLNPDDVDFISTNVKKHVDLFLKKGKEQGLDIAVKEAKYKGTYNILIGGEPRIQVSSVKKLSKSIDVDGIKVVVPEASIVNKVSALNDPNVLFRHDKDLDRLQALIDNKISKKELMKQIDSEDSILQYYSYYAGKGNEVDFASENVKISFGKPSIVIGKADIANVPRSVIDLPVTKRELAEVDRVFDLLRENDAIVKAGGKAETFGQGASDIDKLLTKYKSKENIAKYFRINDYQSKLTGTVPGVGSLSGLRTEAEAIDLVGTNIGRKASNIRGKVGQILGTPDLKLKYDKTTDFGIYFRKEATASEKALIKKFNKQVETNFLKDYASDTVRYDGELLTSFKRASDASDTIIYSSTKPFSGLVSTPLIVVGGALKSSSSSKKVIIKDAPVELSSTSSKTSGSSVSSTRSRTSSSISSKSKSKSLSKSSLKSKEIISGISKSSPGVVSGSSGSVSALSPTGFSSGSNVSRPRTPRPNVPSGGSSGGTVSRIKTPRTIPFPIFRPQPMGQKARPMKTKVYHAQVRTDNNTKWITVTKKRHPVNKAWNMGLNVADNTIAQSVRLTNPKTINKHVQDDSYIRDQKFRTRKPRSKIPGRKVRVEKRGYAIDTLGEKQGLSVAKFLKQKKTRLMLNERFINNKRVRLI